MLDLLSAMREARASGRQDLALRSLDQAEQYLRMLGVQSVFYDAEHAALFDVLPARSGERTVRPALVRDGELVNLEGDPDHPINEGGLCPKGATMFQLRNVVDPETREVIKNPKRSTRPLVRRPGASDWEDISWDDAIAEIARKVKDTRDATFIEKNDNGLTVNYTPAIASLGGSQENSEEEYLILKMMRSLGVIAIDNQARV